MQTSSRASGTASRYLGAAAAAAAAFSSAQANSLQAAGHRKAVCERGVLNPLHPSTPPPPL